MAEDTGNKDLQKIIFVISLVLVVLGVVMMITSGVTKLFEFADPFRQPLTTKQQPFILIFIFAVIALFLTGRNLKRFRSK